MQKKDEEDFHSFIMPFVLLDMLRAKERDMQMEDGYRARPDISVQRLGSRHNG